MSKPFIIFLFISLFCFSCGVQVKQSEIVCTDNACDGIYVGPEFINSSDIAHQFSNKMSARVGDKLKELYKSAKYSKVDFTKIQISTEGKGTGKVTYKINIPYVSVSEKCQAYTSFDYVGGWNHEPELSER
jgi:hypothetical protein